MIDDYDIELERLADEEYAYEAHRASCEPPPDAGYIYTPGVPAGSLTNGLTGERGRHERNIEPKAETVRLDGPSRVETEAETERSTVDDLVMNGAGLGHEIVSDIAYHLEMDQSYCYELKAWRKEE